MSHRINHQPAFLLSSRPWRENSLWLEVFSRDHGRVALLARSARTRGSELRGTLLPFVPLSLSWYGKEELKTLHRAEWIGGWAQPKQRALFAAMYINELVLKLTAREDPHPSIYHALSEIQQCLGNANNPIAALRIFEWQLLHALGLTPDTEKDNLGQTVIETQKYIICPEQALEKYTANTLLPRNAQVIDGATLQQMAQATLTRQSNLQEAFAVTKMLIDFYLPQGIKSREVLQQLAAIKRNLFKQ